MGGSKPLRTVRTMRTGGYSPRDPSFLDKTGEKTPFGLSRKPLPTPVYPRVKSDFLPTSARLCTPPAARWRAMCTTRGIREAYKQWGEGTTLGIREAYKGGYTHPGRLFSPFWTLLGGYSPPSGPFREARLYSFTTLGG